MEIQWYLINAKPHESSSSIYNRCCCCLAEGKHVNNFEAVHMKMFGNYLNLNLNWESIYSPMICSTCVGFLDKVQRFRKMVISSQRHLLHAMHNTGSTQMSKNAKDQCSNLIPTVSTALKEVADHGDTNEVRKLKVEIEMTNNDLHTTCSENITSDIADLKGESTTVEFSPEYLCDWEMLQDIDSNVNNSKIDETLKYDSESNTHISRNINKKSEPKNKIEKEAKSSISANDSRKHSIQDNRKVRSNIILLLKHSTILPFRKNFKCFYCDKVCIPFKELKRHLESDHNDVSEKAISKIVRSLQHLVVTADISCIKCKLCDEEFKSIENLVEHLCSTHKMRYFETDKKPSHGILGVDLSTDTFKCHICNKNFNYLKNLSTHINEHYGSYICYICGSKFLSEHRYKNHLYRVHADREMKCKHCGKTFRTESTMVYHIRKEHIKSKIKCLKCPETFPLGQYVKRLNHMAEMHGIKKPVFKCDMCGKEYGNSGSLAAHIRCTHKRTKEQNCEICGYITVHNASMKKHMDSHNGVKDMKTVCTYEYECKFCKKKFTKLYRLNMHMKIHLNDKRFVCSLCDEAFMQKNCLKSHLMSIHPDSGLDLLVQ